MCYTRSQPEVIQGNPFAQLHVERGRTDVGERRQLRERAPYDSRMGPSAPWEQRGKKRVRKKMIGQDLRYKKRFVPLARAPVRPYGILSPGLRTHGDSGSRGSRGFLQLAPSRITDEKDSGVHSSSLDE